MKKVQTPLGNLIGYAIGGGVFSISINGIAAYAMLYYTQVLGLSARSVGFALSLSAIWDAVSAPIMGHLTDNTRSRFGPRYPYILIGGLALTILFFFLWYVPPFIGNPSMLFWYILLVNLLVRTAETVFVVPYVALGFEITTDYEERAKLQGIYYFFVMAVNFACFGLGWSLFFRDRIGVDGSRLDGTKVASNYLTMSIVLCVVSLVLLLVCVLTTRRYAQDNRSQAGMRNDVKSFRDDLWSIVSDRYAISLFLFFGVATLAMMVVSQIQMFTYVNFMHFSQSQKTFVHGGGMIAFALGSMLQIPVSRRFDKKPAVYMGMGLSISGSLMLLLIFIGGLIPVDGYWVAPAWMSFLGVTKVPISTVLFLVFQGMWWGGIGILVAPVTSMVADISEINFLRTNLLKDGSYSSMFGLLQKGACAVGLLLTGWLLDLSGFSSGAGPQTVESVRNVAILTFISGPIFLLLAFPILWVYPVDREFMEGVKAQLKMRASGVTGTQGAGRGEV